MGLGVPELLLILAIILIVFGAGKLPEIGSALGRGIRSFRKGSAGEPEIDVTPSAERLEGPGSGEEAAGGSVTEGADKDPASKA